MPGEPPHKGSRVLFKLSGEILGGRSGTGIDPGSLGGYARALVDCAAAGWLPGVVIGGGNFVRGARSKAVSRCSADWMGMLATVMNAIALRDAIEAAGGSAGVLCAFPAGPMVREFSPDLASEILGKGGVAVYAGGTGHPHLTTDTAAALRAVQTGCSMLLKGTKVDGIYDSDPVVNPSARRFETLGYNRMLELGLEVMDAAAVAVCRDGSLPLTVFDATDPDNLSRVLRDPSIGTVVREE